MEQVYDLNITFIDKVGKSSLIHSLVNESEDEDVPSILDEVMIAPENQQDPTILITDSGMLVCKLYCR